MPDELRPFDTSNLFDDDWTDCIIVLHPFGIDAQEASEVTLAMLQEAVEGYIESVPLPQGCPIMMYANEEGLLSGSFPNVLATKLMREMWKEPTNSNMVLVGSVVICNSRGGPLRLQEGKEVIDFLSTEVIYGASRNGR